MWGRQSASGRALGVQKASFHLFDRCAQGAVFYRPHLGAPAASGRSTVKLPTLSSRGVGMNMRKSMWCLVALASLASNAATAGGGTIEGKVTGTGSTKPVMVYIENIPDQPAKKMAKQRMAQKDQSFKPPLVIMTAGTVVEFPNDDSVYHNVFSIT